MVPFRISTQKFIQSVEQITAAGMRGKHSVYLYRRQEQEKACTSQEQKFTTEKCACEVDKAFEVRHSKFWEQLMLLS